MCCCCHVTMCCCGAQPLPMGSMIFAIVDIVINLIFAILLGVFFKHALFFGPFVWIIILDLVLLIAVMKKITGLMIVWQVG